MDALNGMMKFPWLSVLLKSIVLSELCCPSAASFEERYGTLNKTVTLSDSYHPGCKLTYTRTSDGNTDISIERVIIENGKPTKRYEKRIELVNNTIRLRWPVLNDGGVYELRCGDAVKEEIKLNVWEPKMVYVKERTAKHDFFIDTNGINSSAILWVLKKIVNGSLHPLPRTCGATSGIGVCVNLSDDGHVSVAFTNVAPSDLGTHALCNSRSDSATCAWERYPLLLHGSGEDKVPCDTSTTSPGCLAVVAAVAASIGALILLLALVVLAVKRGWISEGRVLDLVRWIQNGPPPGPVGFPPPAEQEELLRISTPESGDHTSTPPSGDEEKSSTVIPNY